MTGLNVVIPFVKTYGHILVAVHSIFLQSLEEKCHFVFTYEEHNLEMT